MGKKEKQGNGTQLKKKYGQIKHIWKIREHVWEHIR